MSCDIGDIKISSNDVKFENGQLSATGSFTVYSRSQPRLQYIYPNHGGSNTLEWSWDGKETHILKTKLGDIVLSPVAGAPRVDIEFPKPDFYENGKNVINHNEREKQQGCILK